MLFLVATNLFAFNSKKNNFVFIDTEVMQPEVFNKNVSNFDTNAYHLFSHGRSGELLINGKWLNAKEIETFLHSEFNIQNSTFTNLNIYGCEFAKGEKGLQAVSYLENALGLKVNASTNITGKDGDWLLEVGDVHACEYNNYSYSLQTVSTSHKATACSNCTPTGWTNIAANGTVDVSSTTGWAGNTGSFAWQGTVSAPPISGPNFISGFKNERVETTVTGLTVGESYKLKFAIAELRSTAGSSGKDTSGQNNVVDQSFDGTFRLRDGSGRILADYPFTGGSSNDWSIEEYSFTATATSQVFRFGYAVGNGNNGNFWNLSVDNNSVVDPCNDGANTNGTPTPTDSDGDGINDSCDLDDDNDGILDTDEFCNSSAEPFTSLGMAQNVPSAGIYYFNINGEAFSTYVDADGYVQVAIDFGDGTGNLAQGTALNNTTRGILSPSALSELTDATEVRVSYTGTSKDALDAVSTNATLLQRVTTNTTLHQGVNDNTINDSWTGTNTAVLTADAVGTPTTAGVSLHENLFHTSGNGSGIHWIPSLNLQSISSAGGQIADTESLHLWVKAPAVALPGCNDLDNDNIPNHLDLDSDGDGCPDALEGNAGLNYPILDSEGKIDVTVNNNGIPITLGIGTSGNGTTGQTKGTSQNDGVQADECDSCNSTSTLFKDSDNDTIGDDCDLDDDNDGILDTDEFCNSSADPFTSLGMAQNVPSAGIYYFNLNGEAFSTYVDADGYVQVAIDFGDGVGNLAQGTALNNTTRGILSASALSELTDATEVRVSYTGTSKDPFDAVSTNATLLQRVTTNTTLHQGSADNTINDSWTGTNSAVLTANAPITTSAGTSLHQNLFHTAGNSSGIHWIPSLNFQRISSTTGEIASGESLQLWVKAAAVVLPGCNDLDNDTIPNHLDLDSDGDRCPDALEGNAGLNYPILDSEGKIDTTVNNNGIPITLGVGTSGNGTTGQTKGTSQNDAVQADECDPCNSTSTLFKDSDNDGVGNTCDLDDDNDGILDSDESCTSTAIAHNGSNWLAPDGVGTGITVSSSSTTTSSTVTERTKSSASEITVNTSLNFSVLKDLLINPMAANNNSTTVTFTFSSAIKASEVGLLLEDIYTASSTGSISVAGGTATTSDFNLGNVSNTNAYNIVSFSNPFNR